MCLRPFCSFNCPLCPPRAVSLLAPLPARVLLLLAPSPTLCGKRLHLRGGPVPFPHGCRAERSYSAAAAAAACPRLSAHLQHGGQVETDVGVAVPWLRQVLHGVTTPPAWKIPAPCRVVRAQVVVMCMVPRKELGRGAPWTAPLETRCCRVTGSGASSPPAVFVFLPSSVDACFVGRGKETRVGHLSCVSACVWCLRAYFDSREGLCCTVARLAPFTPLLKSFSSSSSFSSIAVAEMCCMCPVGPENWLSEAGDEKVVPSSVMWAAAGVQNRCFPGGTVRVQCFRYRRLFLCHSRRTRVWDGGCRIVEQCAKGGTKRRRLRRRAQGKLSH